MRSRHLQTSTLKRRRIGYDVNDEAVTRSRLSRMEIDDIQEEIENSSSRATGTPQLGDLD